MRHDVARPSANPFAHDRAPEKTRRAVLAELVAEPYLDTIELQRRVYGTVKVGAGSIASAVGWLNNAKLVERRPPASGSRRDRWRPTDAGRQALALHELLGGAPNARIAADEVRPFTAADFDALAADLPACSQEAPHA